MRRLGLSTTPLMMAVALAGCASDDGVSVFEASAGGEGTGDTSTATAGADESGSGDAGEGGTDGGTPDLPASRRAVSRLYRKRSETLSWLDRYQTREP